MGITPLTAVGRCPHCGTRVRLHLGTRFRCLNAECQREFSLEEARPKIEHFGLTQERINLLNKKVSEVSGIIGIIGAALGLVIGVGSQKEFAIGWYLLGYAVGGYIVGMFIGTLMDRYRTSSIEQTLKKSPAYTDFMRYQLALTQFSDFLRAARQKQQNDQKVRAAAQAESARALHRQREAAQREREEALRNTETWWRGLGARRWEKELALLFRKRGYSAECTGGPGDEGVDMILVKAKLRIIVQVKAHAKYVSPGAVRDLYGSLLHHRADEAWLVSMSGFSTGARSFARGKRIRLLTIRDIIADRGFADVVSQRTSG